jgi:nucleoside-diphosphate-sugar epimerase
VYNIAAIYRSAGVPAEAYRAINRTAVGSLVEAASAAGVRRVVHCSTVGVHGDVEHPPANEDAPLKPGDIYQVTKLEGEQWARETAGRCGIELTIVRPSGIYGPGDRRLFKLFKNVVRGFPILGSGQIYYHLTYIDDLVEGFLLCGEHPAAANRTYILAGGEVTTLNDLVRLTADVAGVK